MGNLENCCSKGGAGERCAKTSVRLLDWDLTRLVSLSSMGKMFLGRFCKHELKCHVTTRIHCIQTVILTAGNEQQWHRACECGQRYPAHSWQPDSQIEKESSEGKSPEQQAPSRVHNHAQRAGSNGQKQAGTESGWDGSARPKQVGRIGVTQFSAHKTEGQGT